MIVKLSEDALRDRRAIVRWYHDTSPAAASRFVSDLRAAIEFIGRYPFGAPIFHGTTRGKTMARFPFTIVYEVLADRIRVMALADERRDPEHTARRFE